MEKGAGAFHPVSELLADDGLITPAILIHVCRIEARRIQHMLDKSEDGSAHLDGSWDTRQDSLRPILETQRRERRSL